VCATEEDSEYESVVCATAEDSECESAVCATAEDSECESVVCATAEDSECESVVCATAEDSEYETVVCATAEDSEYESVVCATVEDSEYERKPASYSELENAFSERSDGISGEVVGRTEATKPEASASSNDLTIINFDDPYLWPELSDGLKCLLIEHGLVQNESAKYSASVRDDGRQFPPDWFTKTLYNGECVNREWLLYSETKKAVFCFPCMLFGRQQSNLVWLIQKWGLMIGGIYLQEYQITKILQSIEQIV
jgi:hypothetical protein